MDDGMIIAAIMKDVTIQVSGVYLVFDRDTPYGYGFVSLNAYVGSDFGHTDIIIVDGYVRAIEYDDSGPVVGSWGLSDLETMCEFLAETNRSRRKARLLAEARENLAIKGMPLEPGRLSYVDLLRCDGSLSRKYRRTRPERRVDEFVRSIFDGGWETPDQNSTEGKLNRASYRLRGMIEEARERDYPLRRD